MKEDGTEVGKVNGEYSPPDAAAALKHHKDHIAPKLVKIDTLRGECSEPWQHIKKHTHMPRPIMNVLLNLQNIEDDAKQQHHVDALFDGLDALGLRRSRDLFSSGEDETLPAIDDDAFEASEAELAAQKSRPSTEKAQADADAAAEAKAEKKAPNRAKPGSKPTFGDVKMKEAEPATAH